MLLLWRVEVRRALDRPVFRWEVDRLERLCELERLGLLDRLADPERDALERLVDPDRAELERFTLELDRDERLPLLLLPRRCASAIVRMPVPVSWSTSNTNAISCMRCLLISVSSRSRSTTAQGHYFYPLSVWWGGKRELSDRVGNGR